jgi:hypothetical protein
MSGELRDEVARRVRRGERPDRIEVELLSSRPGLDEDEIAALWLYAFLAGETPLRESLERPERCARLEYAHD